jgi:methanogenic corrinoid protein MtbC1
MDLAELSLDYETALLSVDQQEARRILDSVFHEKDGLRTIEDIVYTVLERVGNKWEAGEVSLAQIYMAGQITEKIMDEFLPVNSELRISKPNMAICVLDDYHALGKSMVKSVLKSNGYLIKDYGEGLSVDAIVAKVLDDDIDVLLVSTLMIASALNVKKIRQELDKAQSSVKIIAGGAPFRLKENLWKEVGSYARNDSASDIIKIVESLEVS